MASTLAEQLAPVLTQLRHRPRPPQGSLEELIERALESRHGADDRTWYATGPLQCYKQDLVSDIPSKSWTYRRIFPNL